MPSFSDVFLRETRTVLRTLRKERSFTALTVMLLALGIGLASAVFMLLWQVIYAQLPIPQPQHVFTFSSNVTHNGRSDSDANAETFSVPTYRYLAEHFTASSGVIARHGELVNIETPGAPQHLLADFVSGNFFEVLGVKPIIGRSFRDNDDRYSSERWVAMLSYDFWQDAYGGALSAWNSELRINGVPFRIVGVTAPGFRGLIAGQSPKVYLPISAFGDVNPGWRGFNDWSLRWLNPFVRLPADVSAAAAEAELQPVYRAAVREELASQAPQPQEYLRELSREHLSLVPATQGIHAMLDESEEPLRILQWMTLALLSLAVINAAGLALVRGITRRRELLIRYAVGATGPQVMRLHFQETLILALAGGLLGLWIARYGAEILVHLADMDQGGALSYALRGWALGTHWLGALVAGLVVGLFPAWQSAKIDLSAGLNEGALTHSATKSQALIRRTLSAAQIALSLVLVIAAGLFAKTLHQLVTVPVGFNPEHLTVFSVDAKLRNSTVQSGELLWANIARRLRETAGVKDVTYGTGGPFPQGADMAVVIPGATINERSRNQSGMRSIIGPRYFTTLGIPVVAGREFDERDRTNMPDTVILNQSMARKLFDNNNPIGQTVTMFNGVDPNWLATVVGVVADHHQSWTRVDAPLVYTPAQQARRVTEISFYVRTVGPSLSARIIQTIVRQEAPSLASYDIATMSSRMAAFASSNRALTLLVGAFAVFALAIAAVGIYGVVSYSASLRTLEFGVRLSVGATPVDIVRLVLNEALAILASGVVLGAPLTYVTLIIIRHQLGGVSLVEPAIYSSAILLLTISSLIPAWIPAQRAKRLSVNDALRHP